MGRVRAVVSAALSGVRFTSPPERHALGTPRNREQAAHATAPANVLIVATRKERFSFLRDRRAGFKGAQSKSFVGS
jgi:hypothetical protein